MLNFQKFQRADRTEIGIVAELCGQGGSYGIIPSNFNDTDKRVVIVLKRADGTSATATCSTNVSKGLRSKEIKLSQVSQFTIVEQVLPNDEKMNVVVMPSAVGSGVEVAIDSLKDVVAYQPKIQNIEELVAF